MRQQQSNKNRMRGRGRNKPSNSLNRNYESNGPDVKIRGNAAHIAEKYTALARDAQSSGDSVIAENYLQHAEHYNRIVLAAQAQRDEAQANRVRHNDSAQDDQPDINDDDRLEAEGDGDFEDSDRRQANRRNNNGRPPRQREAAGEDEAATAEADGDESPAYDAAEASGDDADEPAKKPARARRTTRAKPQRAGSMTDDAASLPQGLLGNGAGHAVGAEE
ncbi:MAG: DUF4167 domain-containing protein [Nitratireductor sp.]|nr:DUF4167 domain-containing protein [Nitratireductor sp.]